MKKLLLFFTFYILFFSSYSQTQFNNTYDSMEYPFIKSVFYMADTGYVSVGTNIIDSKRVIEINYFDQNGNPIWNKIYGDDTYNTHAGAENACLKTEGGYIMAGSKHLPNQDTNMIYLVKFDEQFETLWTKAFFKGPDWVVARGICNTIDGGFMVVGETELTSDSVFATGANFGLMMKVDVDGNYEWFKSFGTDSYTETFYKVTQTHDGGYLLGGSTKSWQEGLAGIDQGDWYVVKTDSAGQEEWYRRYGNPVLGEGRVTGLIQSSDSCYYLTGGWTYDRIGSSKYKESYVVKLDQNFEEVYELKYDNQAFDQSFPMGIIEAEDQNLVLYGHKYMDFVNYRTTLHKITPEGELLWKRDFAAQNDTSDFTCSALSIKQTLDGGFVLGGMAFSAYTIPYQHQWLVKTDSMGCDGTADFRDCFSVGTDVQTACDSYTWMDENIYTSNNNTANYILTDAAANGMDSLVVLDLTINPSHAINDLQLACETYTWIDGVTYTENNNTAQLMYINQYGCDSIINLNLSIGSNTTGIDVQTSCEAITWIDDNTYSENNNTATFNLEGGSYHGCDSLVTLNLTIDNGAATTDLQTACESFIWIDGTTYTENNNTATFTLSNINGCDSVVSLDLTIYPEYSSADVQTACGSYTWIDGITYTESNNTSTHTLSTSQGCDSIITLDLHINPISTYTDVQQACLSYVWIDGNTYTEDNIIASYTLENTVGCDSIITLDLIIDQVNTSITVNDPSITANATEANFQWLDCNLEYSPINEATEQSFMAESNGLYAVEVTQNNCVDTSDCVQITTVNIEDIKRNESFRLYPNPTNHFVVVTSFTSTTLSNQKVASLEVYDVTGKLVKSITFKEASESQSFDISDLDEGVYMVKVGAYVRKLVVRK